MKTPRKPKRAACAAQISISLPASVLLAIDQLADDDNRTRSNWIVNELEKRIAAVQARKQLERSAPFTSTAGVDAPLVSPRLNEGNPITYKKSNRARKPPKEHRAHTLHIH